MPECVFVPLLEGMYREDVFGVEEEDICDLVQCKSEAQHLRDDVVESMIKHYRFAGEVLEDNEAGNIQTEEGQSSQQVQDRNSTGIEQSNKTGIEQHSIESLVIELTVDDEIVHLFLGLGALGLEHADLHLAPVYDYLEKRTYEKGYGVDCDHLTADLKVPFSGKIGIGLDAELVGWQVY